MFLQPTAKNLFDFILYFFISCIYYFNILLYELETSYDRKAERQVVKTCTHYSDSYAEKHRPIDRQIAELIDRQTDEKKYKETKR